MNKTLTVCTMLALLSGASIQGSYSSDSVPSAGGYSSYKPVGDEVDRAVNEACAAFPYRVGSPEEVAEELFNRIKKLAVLLTKENWKDKTITYFNDLPYKIKQFDVAIADQTFLAASGGGRYENLSLAAHLGKEAACYIYLEEFYKAVQEVLRNQKFNLASKHSHPKPSFRNDEESSNRVEFEDDQDGETILSNRRFLTLAGSTAALAILGVLGYYMFGGSSKKGGRTVVYTK